MSDNRFVQPVRSRLTPVGELLTEEQEIARLAFIHRTTPEEVRRQRDLGVSGLFIRKPLVASGGIPLSINVDLDPEELKWDGEKWEFVPSDYFPLVTWVDGPMWLDEIRTVRGGIEYRKVLASQRITRRDRIKARKEAQKRARRAKWLRPFRAVKRGWVAMINKRPDFDDEWDDDE